MLEETDSKTYEVFISHRSTDFSKTLAETLRVKLTDRGINCFLDTKDISSGESFIQPILKAVRQTRLVIVFFDKEMSSWIHFEASCAFNDEKLLPVSISDAIVPPPYNRIQHETLKEGISKDKVEAALDRVADQAHKKIYGGKDFVGITRLYRKANRYFYSGLPVVLLVFFALFSIIMKMELSDDQLFHEVIKHLHVTLGATILGGQFFLALGFARTVASPSLREREYGFETTERLFGIWVIFAFIQVVLGLYLIKGAAAYSPQPWTWLALSLFIMGFLITCFGYFSAYKAREGDRGHEALPHKISGLQFLASILFAVGFICTVAVINLMIGKSDLFNLP